MTSYKRLKQLGISSGKIKPVINKSVCNTSRKANSFAYIRDPSLSHKKVYISHDPRLISVTHGGDVLALDAIPNDSKTDINTLNENTALDNYGKNYSNVYSINAGDIRYHNNSKSNFFQPEIFSLSSVVNEFTYSDPMDAEKPQYQRKLAGNPNPLTKNYNTNCLTEMQDSQVFRENILSSYAQQQNQREAKTII